MRDQHNSVARYSFAASPLFLFIRLGDCWQRLSAGLIVDYSRGPARGRPSDRRLSRTGRQLGKSALRLFESFSAAFTPIRQRANATWPTPGKFIYMILLGPEKSNGRCVPRNAVLVFC